MMSEDRCQMSDKTPAAETADLIEKETLKKRMSNHKY